MPTRPTHILLIYGAILCLSTGIAFLGYRYLSLAGEYRERNFNHLNATQQALDVASAHPILRQRQIEQISLEVRLAQGQASWCLHVLSSFERQLFKWLGAAPALALCEQDLRTIDLVLERLARISEPDRLFLTGPESAFAQRLMLVDLLERMREDSKRFQPYVEIIEQRLYRLVTTGTALASAALALLFLLFTGQLVRTWDSLARRTDDLRRMSDRFDKAMQASTEGLALYDSDRRLITCNEEYRRLAHPDPEAVLLGMTIEEILLSACRSGYYSLPESEWEGFVASHVARLENETSSVTVTLAGERFVSVRLSHTAFGDMLVSRTDITADRNAEVRRKEHTEALQDAKAEIERQSLTDPLTGLANRRALDAALRRLSPDTSAPLIRVDLDRFKQVNDILGHEAGDFVLQHVAKVLTQNSRSKDIVARVGGDEFVLLCQPDTTAQHAKAIADRILERLRRPVWFGKKRCIFGASFGIAMSRGSGLTGEDLLRNADFALYKAKEAGRGVVEVFSPSMEAEAVQERALADDFVHGLSSGQLTPYFQTQHEATSHNLAGVEVLARWEHPRLGVLPPPRFLHIARQLGMENDLDARIFEAATEIAHRMEGNGTPLPRIAFNVSAARILDPGFLQTASRLITDHRDRYVFEILESVSLENLGEQLRFVIDAVRDLGFGIDLDDFGSEHASINSILNLEPDAVKIDRSIVQRLGKSPRAELMVGSIVDLAQSLGTTVIAEGVDTKAKSDLLRDKGCNLLQGFYFSTPMPADDLRTFLPGSHGPAPNRDAI